MRLEPGDMFGADKKVKEWEKADSPLKLKAEKSKLLGNGKIRDLRCDNEDTNNCSDFGEIMEYFYVLAEKSKEVNIKIKGKEYSEIRRTNNAVVVKENTQLLGAQDAYSEEIYLFYGLGFYYENGGWYDVEYATTTIEAYSEQTATSTTEKIISLIFNNTFADTFFPYTNGDNSEYADAGNWQTRHDATSGTARSGNTCYVQSSQDSSGAGTVERAQLAFDTSSLSDTCVISDVTLSLNGDWERNNSRYWNVFSENGDDTTPDGDDYNDCGTTAYATNIVDPNWDTAAGRNNVFTFNATGKAAVSLTGASFFCIREARYDAPNSAPPQDTTYDGIAFASVRTTGTGDDPLLTVTCSALAGGEEPKKDDIFWFN